MPSNTHSPKNSTESKTTSTQLNNSDPYVELEDTLYQLLADIREKIPAINKSLIALRATNKHHQSSDFKTALTNLGKKTDKLSDSIISETMRHFGFVSHGQAQHENCSESLIEDVHKLKTKWDKQSAEILKDIANIRASVNLSKDAPKEATTTKTSALPSLFSTQQTLPEKTASLQTTPTPSSPKSSKS